MCSELDVVRFICGLNDGECARPRKIIIVNIRAAAEVVSPIVKLYDYLTGGAAGVFAVPVSVHEWPPAFPCCPWPVSGLAMS